MTKIAICFFGITRSLGHTIGSIEANAIAPARELGEVKIFAHFFRQRAIDNPRSGESGHLPEDEHLLLNPDWIELEEPGHCLEERDAEGLKAHGDSWGDDFRSLGNLVHQLHSLETVTEAAAHWHPDVIVFLRPDILYHDSLAPTLSKAVRADDPNRIWVPDWQDAHMGHNDRFAIAGRDAGVAYGTRIRSAHDYCEETGQPLHSERLLRYHLRRKGVDVRFMGVRGTRMRAGGALAPERFQGRRYLAARRALRKLFLKAGLPKDGARKILRGAEFALSRFQVSGRGKTGK